MNIDDTRYRQALERIEALIRHLRANQSAACSLAEEEDLMLMRLADWQTGLQPHHQAAIAEIERLYQHYIRHEPD
ncbi:hypothetical protein [Bergeriella denitrificans]|uniref:Branched-chain amino acid ABC transporter n=1 Tax=Bergeriella denitrificans TaxID=494 RepID=A0A378UGZ9_BERDE|nr:hypothetical protein [Bergeriella denitrificans]STZ76668.1 Uncharacterised protein [Bergeriella denitrificans]